ncbi:PulJ/GspJ family protein [Virgibacillus dokdonensis]|uniref:PulJ/GspJ family protein n=1 Tax=Virgibacillus dokdonensis TaxID=302167 RepID=UPI00098A78C1|nr:type II secretion system protein [Virgibacillus dokdonensis]
MMNRKNERGMTLVEVLAVFVIGAIVSVIAVQILMSGYHAYERAKTNAELRDEADLMMAYLIDELYTLKASEVKAFPNDNNLYFVLQNTEEKIGIVNGKVVIKQKRLPLSSTDITVRPTSTLYKVNEDLFHITLILEKNGYALQLESEIGIINDRSGPKE